MEVGYGARRTTSVELSEKHRALDRKIEEELARPTADDLKIAELKRQKLRLKDEMERLQVSR